MKRMLPAHQFKIGHKTYGLTQADADELYLIFEGKTSYRQAYEWAKVALRLRDLICRQKYVRC